MWFIQRISVPNHPMMIYVSQIPISCLIETHIAVFISVETILSQSVRFRRITRFLFVMQLQVDSDRVHH